MGYFERRFVRPTYLQVVDALEEAAREANEAQKVVDQDREQWNAFVSEIRTEAEGVRQWYRNCPPNQGAGLVGIAWWTDHLGRRHFRVWAGSSADGSFRRLFDPEPDSRPPFWHMAPDRVFSCRHDGQRKWLAVCPCGMIGTPQAIGWMGDRCGLCHYLPADSPVRLSSFTELGDAVRHLEFSPDGRWLAGTGCGRNVHVWDVIAGVYHGAVSPGTVEIRAVAFSPDSRMIAVAGGNRMLRFLDIATGQEIAAYPTPKSVHRVVVAPDNATLAIAGSQDMEVWGRSNASLPWRLVSVCSGPVLSVAFNPSGVLMATGGNGSLEVWLIPERGEQPVKQRYSSWYKEHIRELSFAEDGQSIVTFQVHPNVQPRAVGQRFISCWKVDGTVFPIEHSVTRATNTFCRFSPDGNWLVGGEGNEIGLENVWDQRRWVLFESAPRSKVTAVAFSPDGQTLASGHVDGTVKLWPWRRLLEA